MHSWYQDASVFKGGSYHGFQLVYHKDIHLTIMTLSAIEKGLFFFLDICNEPGRATFKHVTNLLNIPNEMSNNKKEF